jgi:hypothetical protein
MCPRNLIFSLLQEVDRCPTGDLGFVIVDPNPRLLELVPNKPTEGRFIQSLRVSCGLTAYTFSCMYFY